MMARRMTPRRDWSRPLPQPLIIPRLMTLRTLADVRTLIAHLPKERRAFATWRIVAAELEAAAGGADPRDLHAALQLVLAIERVPFRSER